MNKVKNNGSFFVTIEIKEIEDTYDIMEFLNDDQLLELSKWIKEKRKNLNYKE